MKRLTNLFSAFILLFLSCEKQKINKTTAVENDSSEFCHTCNYDCKLYYAIDISNSTYKAEARLKNDTYNGSVKFKQDTLTYFDNLFPNYGGYYSGSAYVPTDSCIWIITGLNSYPTFSVSVFSSVPGLTIVSCPDTISKSQGANIVVNIGNVNGLRSFVSFIPQDFSVTKEMTTGLNTIFFKCPNTNSWQGSTSCEFSATVENLKVVNGPFPIAVNNVVYWHKNIVLVP